MEVVVHIFFCITMTTAQLKTSGLLFTRIGHQKPGSMWIIRTPQSELLMLSRLSPPSCLTQDQAPSVPLQERFLGIL